MNNKKLILVTGPTAIGKTAKAIEIAQQKRTSIISADSRQVYKEMRIGVARPTNEELASVEHHLIAHVSIHDDYNAGKYANEARAIINSLWQTRDEIVVCGGTGLYINALIKGLDALPPKNEILRTELTEMLEKEGLAALQDLLKNKDEEAFNRIEISNPQRVIRAIEIAVSEKPKESNLIPFEYPFEIETIVMELPREEVYNRINRRVDLMVEEGLEEEVKSLDDFRHLNALQTVGYSEWWPYFDGNEKRENVIEKIKQHTRNYAKRQVTWFKHQLYD